MKKPILYLFFALVLPFAAVAENPPLMGWSSWNTYGFQINETVIRAQADAMVSLGFKDCGYNYINIDDGFFGGRDAEGNLLIHPERFPYGLRPLVDYIHSKGLRAGIYSDAGRNTCASYWGEPKDEIGRGVGLYGHDAADLDLYFNPEKLNFDFIKVDYCGADAGNNDEGLDLNVEQRYKEIAAAIKAIGRDDVSWNICRWAFPGTWVCEIADSWRTTEDIYLGWESVKSIINQSLYLSAYTSYGHYNDMDMLEVGRGMTEEEDKTHFGMWCMMSSPLLIGCDLNDIKGNALELMQNKELIALNQNTLGQQAYVVKKENGCYVLVKDAEELNGNKRAIAFYNPTNSAVNASVEFALLDLAGNVKVRDLFEKQNMGTMSGSISADVPAHGTRIYLLEADERLERTVYEAETAWLTKYQELKNYQTEGTANYIEDAGCSGGMKVGYVGNGAENDLQWRNVYSKSGGEYTVRLYFKCGENRAVNLSVNGGVPMVKNLNSGNWNDIGITEFVVNLDKGANVIRLYSDSWMPDFDKMELVRTKPLKLYTVNGSIDGIGNTALPRNVVMNEEFQVVLRPAPGHEAKSLVVRHGIDVDGEQFVDGVQQWREEYVEVSGESATVKAEWVDGEVALYADFVPCKDGEWTLVFSDEFNAPDYSQPVKEKWMRCQRYGATWNRWLSDSEEVIYLQDGDLVARAIPNPDKENDPVDMITGGIKSAGRFGFTYGYVEGRIFTNSWKGHFPAFWMMPEDQSAGWPDCGEIDIWETIDNQSTSYHTVHSNWTYDLKQTGNPQSSYNTNVTYDRYHTFGLMWDETSLTWYVDGKEVAWYNKSADQNSLNQGQWPFDKHFHLILNQSVGNKAWADNPDIDHTYETRFDWVRVYQKRGMENTLGTVGVHSVIGDGAIMVKVADGAVEVAVDIPMDVIVYDIAGRKIDEASVSENHSFVLQKGVYVVCGNKVVVK